jgi:hypothetical protein
MVWRTNRLLAALSLLVCWIQQRHVANASKETCEMVNDQACLAGKHKWIPEAEHRCNIVRMTHSQLFDTFGPLGVPKLHPQPLVLKSDPTRNQHFFTLTSRENITSSLPSNLQVTLSSSNSFSEHRRTIPLVQYLNEIANNNTGETSLDAKSNETWYLFGETYTTEWKNLLTNYTLPPCETCVNELVALSFGIGNRGSGVQWHVHGPGFSEALHGRKHWVLYPDKPRFDANQTSRYWMEHVYTSLSMDKLPYECTLDPGDLIYFPNQWYHATINLDPYTAFVSTFTTEHL